MAGGWLDDIEPVDWENDPHAVFRGRQRRYTIELVYEPPWASRFVARAVTYRGPLKAVAMVTSSFDRDHPDARVLDVSVLGVADDFELDTANDLLSYFEVEG